MESLGAHIAVEKLLRCWPEKAAELLVRYCQDTRVHNEIATYLLYQSRDAQPGAQPDAQPGTTGPSNSLNITLGPQLPRASTDSQYSESPPTRHRLPHRSSISAARFPPLSPPSTVSSTSKHEAAPGEYILLLAFTEGLIKHHVVRMRTAPIPHSLMQKDVVQKRGLTALLSAVEESHVILPHRSSHNGFLQLSVVQCISLEWQRPHSNRTHYGTFYIVPEDTQHMLDVDVLLGYDRPDQADFHPTIAPHPKRPQGSALEEYTQNVRPSAPTPPAPSYHHSDATYDRSASATPIQEPHQRFVENLMARQQAYGVLAQDSRLSQRSPASTALCSQPSNVDCIQPNNSAASGHPSDANNSVEKIRLSFEWGPTPMAMWLDLHAPAEMFFRAFQQQVEKRKRMFARDTVTIYLKQDKNAPDDEAYPLSLESDDLDADWDTTVAWIEENKRDKSPHIYGKVSSES